MRLLYDVLRTHSYQLLDVTNTINLVGNGYVLGHCDSIPHLHLRKSFIIPARGLRKRSINSCLTL